MGKENSPNYKIGWEVGFSMPGAFKLDQLHPFKPLLFQQFFNLSTFIQGGQFLLPQRAKWRKGNSSNSEIGWDRGAYLPGAFKLDHLQPFEPILFWNFSIFFTFILGGQLLLPQRADQWEKGILSTCLNLSENFHQSFTFISFHIRSRRSAGRAAGRRRGTTSWSPASEPRRPAAAVRATCRGYGTVCPKVP